jgi:hypothetical protein
LPIVFAFAGDSTITSDFPAPFPISSGGSDTTLRWPFVARLVRVAATFDRAELRVLAPEVARFRGALFRALLLVVLRVVFFLAAI